MQKRTVGTIVSAKKQWWLKVNTKAFRTGPLSRYFGMPIEEIFIYEEEES